jgi:hypothetical protein
VKRGTEASLQWFARSFTRAPVILAWMGIEDASRARRSVTAEPMQPSPRIATRVSLGCPRARCSRVRAAAGCARTFISSPSSGASRSDDAHAGRDGEHGAARGPALEWRLLQLRRGARLFLPGSRVRHRSALWASEELQRPEWSTEALISPGDRAGGSTAAQGPGCCGIVGPVPSATLDKRLRHRAQTSGRLQQMLVVCQHACI